MNQVADSPMMRKRLVHLLSACVAVTALAVASLEWMSASIAASHPIAVGHTTAIRPERTPREAPAVQSIDSSVESFERQRTRLSRFATH